MDHEQFVAYLFVLDFGQPNGITIIIIIINNANIIISPTATCGTAVRNVLMLMNTFLAFRRLLLLHNHLVRRLSITVSRLLNY